MIVAGAIAALLGLVVPATGCFVSSVDSSPYRQSHPQKRPAANANASDEEKESGSSLTESLLRIAREIEKANAREEAPDKDAHEKSDVDAQWAMSRWGCVMAFTGVWQLLVSVVGLGVLAYTLRLNRDATEAAVQGAEAARAAVKVSEETAKRELRAYLSLRPVGIFFESGPKQFQVVVGQKNNGQTPALRVRFHACIEFQDHPLPSDFDFPFMEPEEGTNVIHPSEGFAVRPVRTIKHEDRVILAGDQIGKRIYVFALLTYEDIFGEKHETRACWWYSNQTLFWELGMLETHQNNGSPKGNEVVKPDFFYTDRFNDAS